MVIFLCSDPAVYHALQMRTAWHRQNFHRFFQLYAETPNLGKCILDRITSYCRLISLQRMVKAWQPQICLDFVVSHLAFASKAEGVPFLQKAGTVFVYPPEDSEDSNNDPSPIAIDCKKSNINVNAILVEDSTEAGGNTM